MSAILESFSKLVPEALKNKISAAELEKIPSIILSNNISFLMEINGLTSDKAVSKSIAEKGFDLSTAQVNRVRNGTSEATSSTLFKLALGLNIPAVDFMYLYDPAGFTDSGKPIGKFLSIDESLLINAVNDAYTSMSVTTNSNSIDVRKLILTALPGYRATLTGNYDSFQKELYEAMNQ